LIFIAITSCVRRHAIDPHQFEVFHEYIDV
jgi:hypothetical protein